ncbi:MAG: hypothetical protein WC595_01540 [Candidatus Nanoarchaeia archaeon]
MLEQIINGTRIKRIASAGLVVLTSCIFEPPIPSVSKDYGKFIDKEDGMLRGDASESETGVDAGIQDYGFSAEAGIPESGPIDSQYADAVIDDVGERLDVYDSGVSLDAVVRDATNPDAIIEVNDSGSCAPTVVMYPLQLLVNQTYCMVLIRNQPIPAECGTLTPFAPNYGPAGTPTRLNCGRNVIPAGIGLEVDNQNSLWSRRSPNGVFTNVLADAVGVYTGALVFLDDQGGNTQVTFPVEVVSEIPDAGGN